MKLPTPRWWYLREGRPGPLLHLLLKPLSWIWTAAGARRLAREGYKMIGPHQNETMAIVRAFACPFVRDDFQRRA